MGKAKRASRNRKRAKLPRKGKAEPQAEAENRIAPGEAPSIEVEARKPDVATEEKEQQEQMLTLLKSYKSERDFMEGLYQKLKSQVEIRNRKGFRYFPLEDERGDGALQATEIKDEDEFFNLVKLNYLKRNCK